jgi:4-oxalocrotonate tautomerase
MPFIQIKVPAVLTDEVKAQLVREVIDRTHDAVGSDPAIINVVIHELSPTSLSVGGRIHGA